MSFRPPFFEGQLRVPHGGQTWSDSKERDPTSQLAPQQKAVQFERGNPKYSSGVWLDFYSVCGVPMCASDFEKLFISFRPSESESGNLEPHSPSEALPRKTNSLVGMVLNGIKPIANGPWFSVNVIQHGASVNHLGPMMNLAPYHGTPLRLWFMGSKWRLQPFKTTSFPSNRRYPRGECFIDDQCMIPKTKKNGNTE